MSTEAYMIAIAVPLALLVLQVAIFGTKFMTRLDFFIQTKMQQDRSSYELKKKIYEEVREISRHLWEKPGRRK